MKVIRIDAISEDDARALLALLPVAEPSGGHTVNELSAMTTEGPALLIGIATESADHFNKSLYIKETGEMYIDSNNDDYIRPINTIPLIDYLRTRKIIAPARL